MNPDDKYSISVFINCPFDETYRPLFEAVVFTVQACGFVARCALEEDNAGDIRIQKIVKIISECQYGIHDLSKADLDKNSKLPRFNMPLELGVFMGADYFIDIKQVASKRKYLVMDREQYRYQKFISDLSGQDIRAHKGDVKKIIQCVRNFLRTSAKQNNLPGAAYFSTRYAEFRQDLPAICQRQNLDTETELPFLDYLYCVTSWLEEQAAGQTENDLRQ